jgi:hypothetical protein
MARLDEHPSLPSHYLIGQLSSRYYMPILVKFNPLCRYSHLFRLATASQMQQLTIPAARPGQNDKRP